MAYWPRDRVQPSTFHPSNLGLLATRSRSTLQPSTLQTFNPSNLQPFKPSTLQTLAKRPRYANNPSPLTPSRDSTKLRTAATIATSLSN
ncbi:MAG: hypothetical protein F6K50_53430 [Moorea sp. SIO3I7]|nr:hypothetical protein [Moorena sp. SIO3I7]